MLKIVVGMGWGWVDRCGDDRGWGKVFVPVQLSIVCKQPGRPSVGRRGEYQRKPQEAYMHTAL